MIKFKILNIFLFCISFFLIHSCKENEVKTNVDGWESFDKINNIRKETYNKVISFAKENMIESTSNNNSSSCKSDFEFKPNEKILLEYCAEEIYWDNDDVGQIHRNVYSHKETGDVTFVELVKGCGLESYRLKDCYYNGYSEFSLNGKWKSKTSTLDLIINASFKENKINFIIFNNNKWVHRIEIKVNELKKYQRNHFDNIIYSGLEKIDYIKAAEKVKNAKEIYFEGEIKHSFYGHGKFYQEIKITKGKLMGKTETFWYNTHERDTLGFNVNISKLGDISDSSMIGMKVKGKVIKAIGKFENYEYSEYGGYDIKVVYRPTAFDKL